MQIYKDIEVESIRTIVTALQINTSLERLAHKVNLLIFLQKLSNSIYIFISQGWKYGEEFMRLFPENQIMRELTLVTNHTVDKTTSFYGIYFFFLRKPQLWVIATCRVD